MGKTGSLNPIEEFKKHCFVTASLETELHSSVKIPLDYLKHKTVIVRLLSYLPCENVCVQPFLWSVSLFERKPLRKGGGPTSRLGHDGQTAGQPRQQRTSCQGEEVSPWVCLLPTKTGQVRFRLPRSPFSVLPFSSHP